MNERGLQVVLVVPPEVAVVAGLPAVLRTAHRLASEEDVERVVLCGASDELRRSWGRVLERLALRNVPEDRLRQEISADAPVLVVAPDGIPVGDGLRQFRWEAEKRGVPATWIWKGRAVCVFEPKGRGVAERASSARAGLLDGAPRDDVLRIEAAEGFWFPLDSLEAVTAAEERLYKSLGHPGDSYFALVDRRLSTAISRRLVRTSVTPNQVTGASLAVGLAGAWLVASADYATCLLGTLLAWFSSILDGCDGEIARLKLMSSEAGRRFDLAGDHLVNFLLLAAIAWHVHRTRPDIADGPLVLLLAVGVTMSALSIWWLFLRKPQRQPAGFERTLQRLASRDFIYLVIPLAALRRLDWFVYAAAYGSHLFWIGLWVIASGRPSTANSVR